MKIPYGHAICVIFVQYRHCIIKLKIISADQNMYSVFKWYRCNDSWDSFYRHSREGYTTI